MIFVIFPDLKVSHVHFIGGMEALHDLENKVKIHTLLLMTKICIALSQEQIFNISFDMRHFSTLLLE